MAVKLKDKAISRNAGWAMTLTLYQDKARTLPFDLTGYTAKSQLRAAESQTSTLLAEITCTIADDPTTGSVQLSLAQSVIAGISAGNGFADLLLAPAVGDSRRVCYWSMMIGDGETAWT